MVTCNGIGLYGDEGIVMVMVCQRSNVSNFVDEPVTRGLYVDVCFERRLRR